MTVLLPNFTASLGLRCMITQDVHYILKFGEN